MIAPSCLVAAVLLIAPPGLFERAQAARDALDYARARALAERALEAGGHDLGATLGLYRLLGEILAGLDQPDAATSVFARLLALDPAASWPEGTSPKIVQPARAARARLAGRRLGLGTRRVAPGTLRVVLEADPLEMVARVRVRCGSAGAFEAARAAVLDLPLAEPCPRADVVALDPHGNELWRATDLAKGSSPVAATPAPPLYADWRAWAIATAVLAAAGTTFALLHLRAKAELDEVNRDSARREFTDARALESRGRWTALAANLSLAVAGATGLVAGLVWLRGGRHEEATVVGVGLAGRF